ncbi:MAG: PLP-dependent aminotransferase family protein [Alphaproteobacteria bacterium]
MMGFDYASLYRSGLPATRPRWTGFPKYNFIGGHNDADAIPVDDFVQSAASVLKREGHTLSTYGLSSGPQGYRPLREFLATSLHERTGMRQSADDILIVSGSLQALDLVNDVLLSPGDVVIVEEATYQGTLQRLSRLGVEYIGAPLDENGIRMDALANILSSLNTENRKPKYIYTIPTVQNPSGSVMPEANRLELLSLAHAHGVPIFEDDCYADLTFDGTRPRAIRALDTNGMVIYCGSFSKTIAPALRVGFITAEPDVIAHALAVKYDGGTGALEQMLIAEYCTEHFERHVGALQGVLSAKCETIMDALDSEFGTTASYAQPKGGIFIWVNLPDAVDTSELATGALEQGVAINPGADWSADPDSGRHRLRLCFGHPSHQDIREGVARLADICHQMTGLPERSGNISRTDS